MPRPMGLNASCCWISWAFCSVLLWVVVRRISEGGCNSPSGRGEIFEYFLWFSMLVSLLFYFTVLVSRTEVGGGGRCWQIRFTFFNLEGEECWSSKMIFSVCGLTSEIW